MRKQIRILTAVLVSTALIIPAASIGAEEEKMTEASSVSMLSEEQYKDSGNQNPSSESLENNMPDVNESIFHVTADEENNSSSGSGMDSEDGSSSVYYDSESGSSSGSDNSENGSSSIFYDSENSSSETFEDSESGSSDWREDIYSTEDEDTDADPGYSIYDDVMDADDMSEETEDGGNEDTGKNKDKDNIKEDEEETDEEEEFDPTRIRISFADGFMPQMIVYEADREDGASEYGCILDDSGMADFLYNKFYMPAILGSASVDYNDLETERTGNIYGNTIQNGLVSYDRLKFVGYDACVYVYGEPVAVTNEMREEKPGIKA
ncbi:MAG: hypothetical protein HUJ73_08455, partial [Eubacterium sp.]|nr:hypothetical protein [Eubacterium sp.]